MLLTSNLYGSSLKICYPLNRFLSKMNFSKNLIPMLICMPAFVSGSCDAAVAFAFNDGTDRIYSIDTTTGSATPLPNPVGVPQILGLTFDPTNGLLYGFTSNTSTFNEVVEIDPTTGVGTIVQNLDISLGSGGGLTIADEPSTYFMTRSGSPLLPNAPSFWTIDRLTGDTTFVDHTGGEFFTGLVYVPTDGILYGTASGSNSLYRINPQNGNPVLIGPLAIAFGNGGLTFSAAEGRLLFIHDGSDLIYEIDRSTGSAIPIGSTGLGTWTALAANGGIVPEPSGVLLVTSSVISLFFHRKRGRHVK